MLPAKLLRLVSDHWEEIANRALARMRVEAPRLGFGRYSEVDFRERAREILQNLGLWLTTEAGFRQRYERLGRVRCQENIPLHEIVYAWQGMKRAMMQYVYEHHGDGGVLETYRRQELEHAADRIFDALIYSAVRGYEDEMRHSIASRRAHGAGGKP